MSRTNLSDQFNPEQRAAWKPKIVRRNTFKFTRDGETVIRLHGTDIVRRLPDGSTILDSNGWKTVTTKDRMNANMPGGYSLVQEKGIWFVVQHGEGSAYWDGAKRIAYFDGIQIPQCFTKLPAQAARQEKVETKLRASIRKFVNKLDKLECLPEPSSGDCFYCQMKIAAGVDAGKPLGDAMGDSDHIRSHIREGYLHGSLLLNALRWVGYPNPALNMALDNRDLQNGRKPSMTKRALRRYLYRQCGLAG